MKWYRMGLLLAGIVFGTSHARADSVLLVLGDSSAFGETDRTQNPSNGDRGYVAPFADYLAGQNGGVRPTVINTAINGETTKSFFSGNVADRASTDGIFLNSNYSGFAPNYPSQHEYLINTILAQIVAGNDIRNVVVQLGANDLSNTAESPGFLALSPDEQTAQIGSTFATVGQNEAQILGEVRSLLPNANLFVIGYHNPYGGTPEHPFYPIAAPAVQGLNGVIAQISVPFGATYVDFYSPIVGRERELTLIDRWQTDPINNVHLNSQGYQVESQQLIDASKPVPAPPSIVLAAFGSLIVIGRRVRSRRQACPS